MDAVQRLDGGGERMIVGGREREEERSEKEGMNLLQSRLFVLACFF
jgi:hypothetical protein